MKSKCRGASLIEILGVCTIMAVVASLSYPTLAGVIADQRMKTTVSQLRLIIKSARQLAVFEGTTVTLCPSADQISCSKEWSDPLIVFTDPNHNEQVDNDEILERQLELKPGEANLRWSSLQPYLQFNREGFTRATNGSLRYCPQDQTKTNSYRKLVISRSGRVRISQPERGLSNDRLNQDFGC
ncbi:GspH/FimT family pseudopilin [Aestuariirhabdus sp. Z084]|uniref:GspH/FimT family pseudopilin n=1 Tax=Aestuariirhabdus haliotis TaxID=2918751 RepID=UPI00201B389F|nr:GspH/FimT family pseudopilin [Aestuariirhabdus haliotis]MCL6416180.1 GspH/FimT family pseudopilin [Aestuariirhabdus haliotis]MCL6420232.1 GspH/FimT family pseudopilin [Aestuariirhabdus haliotis]